MLPMGEAASIVSAISALVAVITVIIIHFQSRSLMRRIERPVISLDSTNVRTPLHTMHLELCFKNIGKNPAVNMALLIYGCRKQESQKLEEIGNIYIVNQKDPGASFVWAVDVSYKKKTNFLFYIEMIYGDIFTGKLYYNKLWLMHRKGESDLKDMDIEDISKIYFLIEKESKIKLFRRRFRIRSGREKERKLKKQRKLKKII